MPTLIKDVRQGVWGLVRNPGFTVVAALALGLGLGVNTANFSVVRVMQLRSLRFRDASGLTVSSRNLISPANYPDTKSRNRVFGDLAAVVDIFHLHLTGAGKPEEVPAGAVSANFFQMIGVKPVIGRAFQPAEDQQGRDRVVILSHQLWRRRFDGNVGILGKSISLSGETYHVIGVLPADFSWNNRRTDVWIPCVIESDSNYRSTGGRAI
jgi:hypothetical protein